MSNDNKTEKFLNSFAKHLAEMRRSKNMTQEQLAMEAGIDRVALANIETGKRRPTLTTIYKIADALNIELKELFKGF